MAPDISVSANVSLQPLNVPGTTGELLFPLKERSCQLQGKSLLLKTILKVSWGHRRAAMCQDPQSLRAT